MAGSAFIEQSIAKQRTCSPFGKRTQTSKIGPSFLFPFSSLRLVIFLWEVSSDTEGPTQNPECGEGYSVLLASGAKPIPGTLTLPAEKLRVMILHGKTMLASQVPIFLST